jgi:uncharacterized protein YbaP (TraB family)
LGIKSVSIKKHRRMNLHKRHLVGNTVMQIALLCLAGVSLLGATEQVSGQPQPNSKLLDEVLVTGEQPGPALWQVRSGDNVLWILGEVSPLPARVTWRSKQFEAVLAETQEVILDGRISVAPATKSQRAAANRANELPYGRTLKDVVSSETYARFEAVRNAFAKGDRKIHLLRPLDAMTKLNMNAIKSLGLAPFGATIAVSNLAEKAKVNVTRLEHTYEDYDEYLRARDKNSTESCLKGLAALENDGAGLKALANAWSIGDIDELRILTPLYSSVRSNNACNVALHDNEQRASDVIAEHRAKWLAAAEKALKNNRSTIAVVQMAELFATDGYVNSLLSGGFEVIEPK